MTTHIIILYAICLVLFASQFLDIRYDRKVLESIQRIHDRCAESSRAYLRLEQRVTLLEKGVKS